MPLLRRFVALPSDDRNVNLFCAGLTEQFCCFTQCRTRGKNVVDEQIVRPGINHKAPRKCEKFLGLLTTSFGVGREVLRDVVAAHKQGSNGHISTPCQRSGDQQHMVIPATADISRGSRNWYDMRVTGQFRQSLIE